MEWRRCGPGAHRACRALACSIAILIASFVPAHAAFRTDNLPDGKAVAPRPDQALIFGTVKVLDESGRTSFPPGGLFARLPALQFFGLLPGGRRTYSPQRLKVHQDGTYAAWLPAGDYALFATWRDEDGELQFAEIAVIRVPGDGRVFYAGELVTQTAATGLFWREFPRPYEVTDVVAIFGASEAARRKIERRSGPLPGPTSILLWCTEGVPGAADPGNARSLERLDAGCGSEIVNDER